MRLTYERLMVLEGLREEPEPLTLERVKEAILAYHAERGHAPTTTSGDASKWLGVEITWAGLNGNLRDGWSGLPGGHSLSSLAVELGLRVKKHKLTEKQIKRAILEFHAEAGEIPGRYSGAATKWFGFNITWCAVNDSLTNGLRGLPEGGSIASLVVALGLKNARHRLTTKKVKNCIKKYFLEKGRPPFRRSGDATKWFGFNITWEGVNSSLSNGYRGLPGGDSLLSICEGLGLRDTRDLTLAMVTKAIRKHTKEKGKPPTHKSGDASKWFGFPLKWSVVNAALRFGSRGLEGGSSLYAHCVSLGLQQPKRTLRTQGIRKAIRLYKEETGKYPTEDSGDASGWFGFGISWNAITKALREGYFGLPGGSSLAKLKKEMGLT